MMCFSSDFATELCQEICKALNWTVSQFSDMMKQENPPTPEQMHVINAVFFVVWTRFGKRIARGYKPGKRDR